MVAPTPMETARSLMAQIADWLLAAVWALAIGSIPGMAIGLIPWSVFGAVWGPCPPGGGGGRTIGARRAAPAGAGIPGPPLPALAVEPPAEIARVIKPLHQLVDGDVLKRRHRGVQHVRDERTCALDLPHSEGLSPRRRGNPVGHGLSSSSSGPIPAQAGEPGWLRAAMRYTRAYPRAGGGTSFFRAREYTGLGLSPRRRGNPAMALYAGHLAGPIPAQAGEPTHRPGIAALPGAYPRAGGGTGEPATPNAGARRHGAYPRAGGGTCRDQGCVSHHQGLSPRRRGNRGRGPTSQARQGPIPAQAGEP